MSAALDARLSKEALKSRLAALVDPSGNPRSWPVLAAIGAAIDFGAPDATLKAVTGQCDRAGAEPGRVPGLWQERACPAAAGIGICCRAYCKKRSMPVCQLRDD